jgi:hypothetical protein
LVKARKSSSAPKVLIIGGSSHGFSTTKLYDAIKSKSAYQTKIIMPKSLEKMLGPAIPDAIFVEATSTGEIAHTAKNEICSAMLWAEAIIFSDDIGNNSQTEILVTELLRELVSPAYFVGHAIDLLQKSDQEAIKNPCIIMVGELAKISKLNSETHSQIALLQADGIVKLVEKMQTVSTSWLATIATESQNQLLIASDGRVSTTKDIGEDWQVNFVANSVQFAKLFDSKQFEGLTTGAFLVQTRT